MLRAADTTQRTDTGRQRRGNEDSSLAHPPVFVVADGMGGAQAGEVASQIAVEAFAQGLPDTGTPEERLAVRVREANKRIYDVSRSEHERAGMGTTLTAALLDDTHVAIAHVGDSRAYLFRDGELQRLTRDHSLVGELVERGKLTEQQAEEHPQRSIITRALGPEPTVIVDTWSYPVHADDVLLLCSDGLTSMVSESRIAEILRTAESLDHTADRLIAEANEAGGRDNITVVLFRVEDVGVDAAVDAPTMVGERAAVAPADRDQTTVTPADGDQTTVAPADRDQTTVTPADGAQTTAAPAVVPPPDTAAQRATTSAVRVPLARTQGRPTETPNGGRTRNRRYIKPLAALLATVIVLALILAGGYLATRELYFIGTNDQGIVTVYRGLPYDLPAGIKLYETFYVSGVPASELPADRRSTLLNHHLRSQTDAEKLMRSVELGQLAK